MFWGQTLAQLFSKTGFTAWPLLLCSIIGLAIIVERALYFFTLRFDFTDFRRKLFILLREKRLMEAIHLCEKAVNPVVYLAGIYLKNVNNKRRDSTLTREGSFAIEKVERRLRWLATITHIAPLLGLLGTVTGLVAAFHQIEILGGNVQAQNLAAGIWEALLSTVFGLMVAIPCMVAYHAFEGQADVISRRMQFIISELDEFFGYKTTKDFKAADPESDEEQAKAAE